LSEYRLRQRKVESLQEVPVSNEPQKETSELTAEIDAIVAQIKRAILALEEDTPAGGSSLSITSADLTLNAVVTKDVGGNLKFKLFGHDFGAGVDLSKADTQTIELKLTPVPDEAVVFGIEEVSTKLVNAMRAIRASVAKAAASPPRFDLDEASIELNFQIDKDGTIDFILAGEAKTTNVQTIKLALGKA
jgi:Trypsin-co-occurring domain 2